MTTKLRYENNQIVKTVTDGETSETYTFALPKESGALKLNNVDQIYRCVFRISDVSISKWEDTVKYNCIYFNLYTKDGNSLYTKYKYEYSYPSPSRQEAHEIDDIANDLEAAQGLNAEQMQLSAIGSWKMSGEMKATTILKFSYDENNEEYILRVPAADATVATKVFYGTDKLYLQCLSCDKIDLEEN